MNTFLNVLSTLALTALCSLILLLAYRHALRPILLRHNVIPLRHLPSTLSHAWNNRARSDGSGWQSIATDRASFDEDADLRRNSDLEEGFRDESDDEAAGDERVRRKTRVQTEEEERYTDAPGSGYKDAEADADEGVDVVETADERSVERPPMPAERIGR